MSPTSAARPALAQRWPLAITRRWPLAIARSLPLAITRSLPLALALAVALAGCRDGQSRRQAVTVPGWRCAYTGRGCDCTRLGTGTPPPPEAIHDACQDRDYPVCVASTRSGEGAPSHCACTDGTLKLGDGDVRVGQCPPAAE
jgi:hypothetical protein